MPISNELLSVSCAFLFTLLFLLVAIRGGTKMMKDRSERINKALPAEARIVSYEQRQGGRDNRGRYASIRFELEVTPADHKPPYTATSCWKVYPLGAPSVQPQKYVAVRVDAKDPQVIYPDLPSVEYDWLQAQIEKG
jgi:hypothetical protein